MLAQSQWATDSENASDTRANSLREFHRVGRGLWSKVSSREWNDWQWQLRHRIVSIDQLEQLLPTLTPEEKAGARLASQKLSLAITPYLFNLIDSQDPTCPIRRQVVPRIEETRIRPWELADPCDEEEHSPVPGLVHRYPDRVLLLLTDRCASYCRYCTRSRLVSGAAGQSLHPQLERQIEYLRRHRDVRDVLCSGGDPLLLSDDHLDHVLGQLRAIPHLEFLRLGSRAPIFLPQRITRSLCQKLKRHHPLFISVHTNHPRELTSESRKALQRLADAGIPLGNQSVLLRGVNDQETVMRALVQKLLRCRVKPYYLYQCDLINGSSHFRVSVKRGLRIMESLRGHTSGYAVPQFVIDAPHGAGKIPINPQYLLRHYDDRLLLRNFEGRCIEYPEAVDADADAETWPARPQSSTQTPDV